MARLLLQFAHGEKHALCTHASGTKLKLLMTSCRAVIKTRAHPANTAKKGPQIPRQGDNSISMCMHRKIVGGSEEEGMVLHSSKSARNPIVCVWSFLPTISDKS